MRITISKTIFITGHAGFIGFHLANFLLDNKFDVVGLDAMTKYYDVNLKNDRLDILKKKKNFHSYFGSILDKDILDEIQKNHKPEIIIHLAAQAGVRYSIENPISYVENNLLGTYHILEMSRKFKPKHLLMASTSSVYGNNSKLPFDENQKCDNPISFYAATKKSNEVMAHSYSHLFSLPITMFRFFTVYGPWGRPDMALFKFTKSILNGIPIDIYNHGNMKRDFTHVKDLVKAVSLLIDTKPLSPNKRKTKFKNDNISPTAPFRVVNIGNSNSVNLLDYIKQLEFELGIISKKNFLGMQAGDIEVTLSNVNLLHELTGFQPKIQIKEGIEEFVNWYKSYYQ